MDKTGVGGLSWDTRSKEPSRASEQEKAEYKKKRKTNKRKGDGASRECMEKGAREIGGKGKEQGQDAWGRRD